MRLILSLFIFTMILSYQSLFSQESQKNRVIVLTDIEADPDDTQSLVRLLLYSNEIDKKETIHFILKVTDIGSPPLSRYKRVVVNLVPK